MQDTLPSLKEAVGAEAYGHRPRYNMSIRTTSLGAPTWNAPQWPAHPNDGRQRPCQGASSVHQDTNFGIQYSPHLHSAGPYSRHPSLSTSSVDLSAAESVEMYCTSPSTTSCSSDTFGTSSTRKRTPIKKAGSDRRTQNPIKNQKEKKHRSDLGGLHIELQDVLVNYGGTMVGSGQMVGNKKSSGLSYTKLDILNAILAVLRHLLDKEYRQALINDDVAQFQEELVRTQREHREPTNPDSDPAFNTLMRGTGAPCVRGDNEICAKHGKLDWTVCRPKRVGEVFKRNQEMFLREHTLESKKRRMV